MEDIGKALKKRFGVGVNFTIAGSFAAAVMAFYEFGIELLYNDIDVFVLATQLPGFRANGPLGRYWIYMHATGLRIVNVTWTEGIIQDSSISLNVILVTPTAATPRSPYRNELYLEKLVGSFDINAVQAGFNAYWDATYCNWKLSKCYATPHFLRFVQTRVLLIPDIGSLRSPAKSIIRMALKSHQLHLEMQLPSGTRDIMIKSWPLTEAVVLKWDSLPQSIKELPEFQSLIVRGPSGPLHFSSFTVA
jgi:hypothetical protein